MEESWGTRDDAGQRGRGGEVGLCRGVSHTHIEQSTT